MPITKSAKKAVRQTKTRRARNIQRKNKLKGLVKEVRGLVAEKKVAEAKKLMPQIYKTLDKTAKVGLIKKNAANRNKSRLTKLVNAKKEA